MTDVYTHGHHESVLRSHSWRTAANSAAHLLPHLREGQRLLDVGCGPGTITVDLAAHVAPGQVIGVDTSAEVLERARRHAAELGAPVSFQVGDVYALDFPDASFDVVHAHQVLEHLADPVAALREIRRVIRPGSRQVRGPGASPLRRIASGGRRCGPSGWCRRTSRGRRRHTAWPTTSRWRHSATPGSPGAPHRTAGTRACTARSSPGCERVSALVGLIGRPHRDSGRTPL